MPNDAQPTHDASGHVCSTAELASLVAEAKALCEIDYCFGEADRQAKELRAWRLISRLAQLPETQPQGIEGLLRRDLAKPMAEAIFPSAEMITGDGRMMSDEESCLWIDLLRNQPSIGCR